MLDGFRTGSGQTRSSQKLRNAAIPPNEISCEHVYKMPQDVSNYDKNAATRVRLKPNITNI